MNIETFQVELPHGIHLSCRAAGRADAPLLLFMHGFPEAAFVWDELMLSLADRFRCVAPNLRGYEKSSAPAEVEAYRPKHLASDMVALVEHLGAPLAALVAHDWGGAVAWGIAAQRGDLLERLVIINAPHAGTFLRDLKSDPVQQKASAYMNWFCRSDAEQLLAQDDFARLWRMLGKPGTQAAQPAWLTDALKDQYRKVWAAGLTGPLNYYRASPLRPPMPDDPGARNVTLDPQKLTVRVPTLVIWAEADAALPAKLVDGLEEYVQQLTLVRVPGASHWIVHEQPALVAQALREFVG
jgi:pimeloyl-ACP methyl ester carboxylesterase